MSTEYDINYDDQRFQDVEAAKENAISENEKLYSGMIEDSNGYYQAQVDATKEWEKKQTQLQQEQTDFAIEKVEQQKEQAKKDYIKEQSGAYVDWQKQSNEYGANAEKEAEIGMADTGYSESSQVMMYNAYQQRKATARESYNIIVQNYNNAITEARLQNNAALAEIAYNSLQKQLELNLQGFQYKNQLLLEMSNKKTELEQIYHERWQDVLTQINTENALSEQVRQFNESMALEREMFEWQKARSSGGGGSGGGGGGSGSSATNQLQKALEDAGEKQTKIKKTETPVGYGSTKYQVNKASEPLNAAIASGATKNDVSTAISLAVKNGKITPAAAAELRKTYTPRGYTY